jgi:hypothetical protein
MQTKNWSGLSIKTIYMKAKLLACVKSITSKVLHLNITNETFLSGKIIEKKNKF